MISYRRAGAVVAATAEPETAQRPRLDGETGRVARGIGYLGVFAAAALAAGLGRAVVTSYLPLLLNEIREAPGLIGTAMLVNAAAGFLVPLVIGVWSDRRDGGQRIPFVAGGALVTAAGVGAIALGTGTSYVLLAAFGAVAYVGLNAITTAHRALVPENFSDASGRARATSAQELALLVGTLAGVAAGGALTTVGNWAPFAMAAAVVPALALPTVLRVRESPTADRPESNGRAVSYYLRSAARPGVRAFLAAQMLWVLGYAALPAFFLLYAQEELGLAPAIASIWLVGFGLITGAAVVAAGRVKDEVRQRSLLTLGVTLMGAGFLGVASTANYFAIAGALGAAGIGFGLVSTLGFSLFSALIPNGQAGGYTAMFFSVRAIAAAVALPVAGWAIALSGSYRTLFVLSGAVTLAALVPLSRVCGDCPRMAFNLPSPHWLVRWSAYLLAVWGLTVGTAHLIGRTALQRLDEALFQTVNGLGHGPEELWEALNPHLRNYILLGVLAGVAALLSDPRLVWRVAALVLGSALLAWGLLEAVYAGFDRPRPEEVLDSTKIVLDGNTWGYIESFPSGHMAITTALAAATAFMFPRLRTALWVYVLVIAFTRVLFGAHFPLDTVAGIVLGYVSARAVYALFLEAGLLEPRREAEGNRFATLLDRERPA